MYLAIFFSAGLFQSLFQLFCDTIHLLLLMANYYMRYLSWTLKIILFLILLSFALQNTDIVTLNAFVGYHWQAPLIVIMLACFVVGTVFGVLASFTYMIKLRRELAVARQACKNTLPTPVAHIVEAPRDAL